MAVSYRPITLSKSTFVRGCKCLKSLYLYKHHYELRDQITTAQQAVFNQGHMIGEYAHQLFPGGTNCSVEPAYDYAASINKTNKALQDGVQVLYEPGFMYNHVYSALDILLVKNNAWHVLEVKSTNSVKDYHIMDAAIQWYILKGLDQPVQAIHIVHLNRNYVRKGEINVAELFTVADVTEQAMALQPFVHSQLQVMFNTLRGKTIPQMNIGPQCDKYYSCDYQGYCWKPFENVQHPVYNISRVSEKQLSWLVDNGVLCQTQIPADFPLTPLQQMQVTANKTGINPEPDFAAIDEFIQTIKPPIAFLDFETFATPIPIYDSSRPYQQVPFQFSIHTMDESLEVEHHSFLGDARNDPREPLIKSMVTLLKNANSVVCYNKAFESTRIKELAHSLPAYADDLHELEEKLVDLATPFVKRFLYHHKMNGRAGLKHVLPAFLPQLSYENLEIQEGGCASQAYLDMMVETDEDKKKATRTALEEYCKMDTLAMVELYRYLLNLQNTAIFKPSS